MNSQEEKSEQYLNFYRENIKRISENSSPFINSFREPAIREVHSAWDPDEEK